MSAAHFLYSITPRPEGFLILLRLSFVVDAENDTSAEEGRVFVSETSVVIVHLIPEALGSKTDTLAIDLSDNTLNNNFVARHVQTLNGRSNLVDDILSLLLSVDGIVVLTLKVELNHFLNDLLNSGGVESINKKED
jgi:hypothetical protein